MVVGQEKPVMEFIETEHDFGEIKEEDGPAVFEFSFINNGEKPIVLSNVKASCGCTTPAWSREPVMPGERGFVKAQYNPRNRPGTFRKSLTITSNAVPARSYLYIKGKVIPRVKTIEEKLPYKVGGLRMTNQTFNLSRITTQKPVERSYDIYNAGEDTIRIQDNVMTPSFIQLKFENKILAPKQTGQMSIWLDPGSADGLGLTDNSVVFYTDEKENAQKSISVRATIQEYFGNLTEEELTNAPSLQIAERMKDLGKMTSGTTKTETFELKNVGKTDLNIRKVETNCSCLKAELKKENIKAGSSVELVVTFDSARRRGRQTKSVTIYSNDPKDPTQMVTVKTQVVATN